MKGFKDTIRQNKFLRWILLFTNWLFQGILHADRTEKLYKIFFSLFVSVFFILIIHYALNYGLLFSIIGGFFIGHTLNWIINNNFTNIIIHRLFLSKLDKEHAFLYLASIANRLSEKSFVLYATTHGSICNGNLKPSSDIDIALVRKKGFVNALKSLWFVLLEKKIADFKGIPLEIYLCDTPLNAKRRFNAEQNPVVLYDSNRELDNHYKEKLTLSEARILNGV